MNERFPVYKIEDVFHFDKYAPRASKALQVWSWIQMTVVLLLISYLFGNIAAIHKMNETYIYIYGAFIFLSVYAYTDLMDRSSFAIFWETIKNTSGVVLIYQQGDWFGASEFIPGIHIALMAYFVIATLTTGWFVYIHYKEDRQQNSPCRVKLPQSDYRTILSQGEGVSKVVIAIPPLAYCVPTNILEHG